MRDPLTGVAVPGQRHPASRFNPRAVAMLPLFPQANNPGDPTRNYVSSPNLLDDLHVGSGRLDYNLSPSNTVHRALLDLLGHAVHARRGAGGGDRRAQAQPVVRRHLDARVRLEHGAGSAGRHRTRLQRHVPRRLRRPPTGARSSASPARCRRRRPTAWARARRCSPSPASRRSTRTTTPSSARTTCGRCSYVLAQNLGNHSLKAGGEVPLAADGARRLAQSAGHLHVHGPLHRQRDGRLPARLSQPDDDVRRPRVHGAGELADGALPAGRVARCRRASP